MADKRKRRRRKYAALKRAVEDAGFFVPQVFEEPARDYLVCNSKYHKRYGYAGSTVSVTETAGSWYLVTMHPNHFRILDPSRVGQVVIAFLGQHAQRGSQVVDDGVDVEKELLPITAEEYERAVRWGGGAEAELG